MGKYSSDYKLASTLEEYAPLVLERKIELFEDVVRGCHEVGFGCWRSWPVRYSTAPLEILETAEELRLPKLVQSWFRNWILAGCAHPSFEGRVSEGTAQVGPDPSRDRPESEYKRPG